MFIELIPQRKSQGGGWREGKRGGESWEFFLTEDDFFFFFFAVCWMGKKKKAQYNFSAGKQSRFLLRCSSRGERAPCSHGAGLGASRTPSDPRGSYGAAPVLGPVSQEPPIPLGRGDESPMSLRTVS